MFGSDLALFSSRTQRFFSATTLPSAGILLASFNLSSQVRQFWIQPQTHHYFSRRLLSSSRCENNVIMTSSFIHAGTRMSLTRTKGRSQESVSIDQSLLPNSPLNKFCRFSLKFQSIVEEEQDANFISRLHNGRLDILPWLEFTADVDLFMNDEYIMTGQSLNRRNFTSFSQH